MDSLSVAARRLVSVVIYHLASLVPADPRRLVFGAWHGRRYADNPRHLMEFLAGHRPDLNLVWSGEAEIRDALPRATNVRFVDRTSVRSAWEVARARAVFVSHGVDDVARWNSTGSSTRLVYLGHGIAIKRMGSGPARRRSWIHPTTWQFWRSAVSFDLFVASSDVHREKLIAEYGSEGAGPSTVLMTGQPRCDLFLSEQRPEFALGLREMFHRRHSIPLDRTIVTYMPTFRDLGSGAFSFRSISADDQGRLEGVLQKQGAVLVERSHFVDGVLRAGTSDERLSHVFDLSSASDVDSLELLLVSDVLITDYSGAYIDFLLLDRPVVHFAYDREQYLSQDRGLYFDFADVAGGVIVSDFNGLLEAIEEALVRPTADRRRRGRLRDCLLSVEEGQSCQSVVDGILGRSEAGF